MSNVLLSRRRLLGSMAALGVTAVAGASITSQSGRPAISSIQLGAQTNAWPINPTDFSSFLTALRQVKQVGYAGFETGFLNLRSQSKTPEEGRREIEASGLTFIGVHIFLPEYESTGIASPQLYEGVARLGAALGAERLILSGSPAVTADEIRAKGDALNQAGRFAQKLGLKVAYHNHWPEFKYKAKEIEALYAATEPGLVWFVLDAGHAFRTGVDIAAFVRAHSARLTAIHFRDYRNGSQVPLGEGDFPLAAVASALQEVKWQGWAMNEEEREDGSKQGLAVIQPAFQALKAAFAA